MILPKLTHQSIDLATLNLESVKIVNGVGCLKCTQTEEH